MPDLLESPDAGRRDRELTAPVGPAFQPDFAALSSLTLRLSSLTLRLSSSDVAALQPDVAASQLDLGSLPVGPPILLFQHVSKWYGPVIGVNQVTLELRPGITGLVGHNGSGKSTLLRLAAGQTRPDLGAVQVAGADAWSAEAKRHIGYCPELDTFYEEMSGRRLLCRRCRAGLCGYPRAEPACGAPRRPCTWSAWTRGPTASSPAIPRACGSAASSFRSQAALARSGIAPARRAP